jgi:hypothetical protein
VPREEPVITEAELNHRRTGYGETFEPQTPTEFFRRKWRMSNVFYGSVGPISREHSPVLVVVLQKVVGGNSSCLRLKHLKRSHQLSGQLKAALELVSAQTDSELDLAAIEGHCRQQVTLEVRTRLKRAKYRIFHHSATKHRG